MSALQNFSDFPLRFHDETGRSRLDSDIRDIRSPKSIAADDSSLGRGNRNEDHIILVTALWGFSLGSHRADNHEWYPLDSHHLPNGIFLWKQLLNNRLADDR